MKRLKYISRILLGVSIITLIFNIINFLNYKENIYSKWIFWISIIAYNTINLVRDIKLKNDIKSKK
ncbi:hypothetical protein [Clostridium baratii]|uniref:hypothetical protein n=1 Tax=Clostridium baratii TaxID=1561 RepID=UPI0030CF3545